MIQKIFALVSTYALSPLGTLLLLWSLSLFLMLIIGRPLIHWLKFRKGMKWAPREDTPDTHLQKAGVPSMGGIGIIGAAIVGELALIVFDISFVKLTTPAAFPTLASFRVLTIFPILVGLHAALGYADDHSKATNTGGLSSRAKLLGQIVLAALFLEVVSVFAVPFSSSPNSYLSWLIPFFVSWPLVLGALLVIIGTSNAVNLTDGIDGLAAGLSVQVAVVFSILTFDFVVGPPNMAPISVCSFWAALGGACLGFLAFNKYPAKIFMGDTGSLALGGGVWARARS